MMDRDGIASPVADFFKVHNPRPTLILRSRTGAVPKYMDGEPIVPTIRSDEVLSAIRDNPIGYLGALKDRSEKCRTGGSSGNCATFDRQVLERTAFLTLK